MKNALEHRTADHDIEALFLKRWSPRAMDGTPLATPDMMRLFEAARWAPSTYNEQEWRFLYARPDTAQWSVFMDLLFEGNRAWCQRAGLLCVILGHKVFTKNGKPNPVHVFDCGLAFENLALQGAAMDLVVHGMAGFDFDRVRTELNVPDDYAVAAMFAAGYPGDLADLPEAMRKLEVPSGRRPVADSICEGPFKFKT